MTRIIITKENREERTRYASSVITQKLEGGKVELAILRPSRSREQEKLYHKLIGIIAEQIKVMANKYDVAIWKALLVDQFAQDKQAAGSPLGKPGSVFPAMDGSGRLVSVRPSTTGFTVAESSEFIEFIYAQGIELGVKWPASKHDLMELGEWNG
ncbi:MAG TPA: recombination protein NinB [Pseudomonadales bacterium]|nr:recombination protein NinB [Pseudomonadales bacterium]